MQVIFFDKDGEELPENEQGNYCLTYDGEVAVWDDSQGWDTTYCEGMTFVISAPEENDE